MRSLGQRYSVVGFACAFTRASSFTLHSVRGVLCSVQFLVFFKRFFSVFCSIVLCSGLPSLHHRLSTY